MSQQVTPQGFTVSGRNARAFNETMRGVLSGSSSIKDFEKLANKVKAINKGGDTVFDSADLNLLQKLGISMPALKSGKVMDAQFATQVAQSIPNPVQFLQTFLPGVVRVFQDPCYADEAFGFTQVGFWEDAQIIQRKMERTGFVREYGDNQAKPNTSWTLGFEVRNPVRFEIGLSVDKLQEARASRTQVSDADEKRGAANDVAEQIINNVAWFGYSGGNNLTYGALTDPGLPSVVPFANGALASPLWANKTFLEMVKDLGSMHGGLTTQTKGRLKTGGRDGIKSTLLVPVASYTYFTQTMNALGSQSLLQWYEETYPNSRIVTVPQLDLSLSGGTVNQMVLFAEEIPNIQSTDDKAPFTQMIQTKWMPLGIEQKIGGYKEGYTFATAGMLVKYPLAIYRASAM